MGSRFKKMWPTIVEFVLKPPKDLFVCSLDECCEYVDYVCLRLVAVNQKLKSAIDKLHQPIPNPSRKYQKQIIQEIVATFSSRDSLMQFMGDSQEIFSEVSDWSDVFAKKNQPM